MGDFAPLEIGAVFAVENWSRYDDTVKYTLHTVTRLTPTQVIAVQEGRHIEQRYSRKDGIEIRSGYSCDKLIPVTPEIMRSRETQALAERLATAFETRARVMLGYGYDALVQIAAVLDAAKAAKEAANADCES